MPTTCERFRGAALTLVGAAPLKQRLALAYRDCLASLTEPEIPWEIRQDFRALAESMCQSRPVGGLGVVEASVRKMSDREAEVHATRILTMYSVLVEGGNATGRAPALRAVGTLDA